MLRLLLFSIYLACCCFSVVSSGQDKFRPVTVIAEAFPAIKNAKILAAADPQISLEDHELVLGVKIGKEARAYPINMLNGPTREIINDKLGDTNIAATW